MKDDILLHFEKNDPVIFALIPHIEVFQLAESDNYFLELCDHIISQQLSLQAGNAIFERLKDLFPKREITAERLIQLTDDQLRSIGLSRPKVAYLKDLAHKVINNEIPFEKFQHMSDEEVIAELIKIKGVGVWTAEMFLMTSLAREDVFSYGDLGLRKAIQRWYKLPQEPTKEEAEAIALKWSPYRTYACKILWRSLKITL